MPDNVRATPISVRLPPKLFEKLDKLASALDRSRSWVLVHAFREYLKDEGQEILDVQEGIEAADRGETISSEQLFAELDEIIARAAAKRAKG